MSELNKANVRFQIVYLSIIIIAIALIAIFISRKYVWIIGVAAGIMSVPIGRSVQKKQYTSIIKKSTKRIDT